MLLWASLLFAISYSVFPELRQIRIAWEIRYAATTIGLVFVYIMSRVGFERLPASAPFIRRAVEVIGRLGFWLLLGIVPTWFLWSLADPIADQYTLFEVWEQARPGELALCALGWFAWGIVFGATLCLVWRRLVKRNGIAASS